MSPEIPVTDVRSDAMRLLSNGVYVLTACLGDTLHAATVSWVSQVSFQPPLVMVALQRNSHLAHAVRKAHRFAINILGVDQQMLAENFFAHITAPAGAPALAGHPLREGVAHCPLITDAMAWLECRLDAELPSPGDHNILLGEVTGAGIRHPGAPIVLWETPWSYGGLSAS